MTVEYKMNHRNVKILQIFYSIYENTILIKLLWLISIYILLGINLICSQIVSEYKDTLMISENKLDDTFPHALYHLKDFSNPYRLDRNSHVGGILVYLRDNIHLIQLSLTKSLKTLKVSLLNQNCLRKTIGCLVIPIIHIKVTQNNIYLISVSAQMN